MRVAAGWRSGTGLLAAAGVVAALGYLAVFVARPGGEPGVQLLSDFGEIPVELAGIALALVVVVREPRRLGRLAWALVALGCFCNLIGNVVYGSYDLAGQQPFPSIADGFYLAFYPLLLLGLLTLPTASARKDLFEWRVWSNVAIVIVGGGMALLHFVLLPTLRQLDGEPLAAVISLAYPAGDLAILTALATILARRPFAADRGMMAWLVVAIAVWLVADVLFAIVSADGSYTAGSASDLLWVAGDLAFVLAAQSRLATLSHADRTIPGTVTTLARLGPYAMLALGLTTLVAAAVASFQEMAVLSVMTAFLTALVVVRQLIDENRRRLAEAALLADHAAAAERAARQARHDALTGLANRTRLHELLDAEVDASSLTGRPVTLAFMDLDRFKLVNDSLGHAAGDELLIEVARRLEQAVRATDTVARLGGDEFAIILPGARPTRALEVMNRANTALQEPFVLAGTELLVGGSFGLATFPDCGATDGDGLMRRADTTMYRAKRGRLGPTAYHAGLDELNTEVSALSRLRAAIEGNGLVLQYQPIRERRTALIVAVEALVRMRLEDGSLLAPAGFLPLATQAGLMVALDARVVDLACAQARAWRSAGLTMDMHVNVSRDSVQDPGFPELLEMTLRRHDLPGAGLLLEVTEDGIPEGPEGAHLFFDGVGDLGVRTAIDDFGTGSSSLRRLRDLPVDLLKIDRSFVSRALTEPEDAVIVEAVVGLAHRLGKLVVAEGVEDGATLDYVDALGVDFAQGFHVGRPMAPGQIIERTDVRSGPPVPVDPIAPPAAS